ncbi:MAG: DNA mismatch repair protein MutS, partial [Firmicutes bacterium]|nr:DNA mismatch repair protein MutS [Bacillota bacterium]
MKLTPMMQQYYQLKEEYPDSILFFRLGDFYEMFGDDAKVASKVLEIALTSREAGPQGRIPMCGVPHHAAEGYLEKLVRSGYRVALCEQMEDPREAKGVVKRDVVRVITPGTFIEGNLAAEDNQFLVAVARESRTMGLASLDMSTGEFMTVTLDRWSSLENELRRLRPAEIVVSPDWDGLEDLRTLSGDLASIITEVPTDQGGLANASQTLLNHFSVSTLKTFGLTNAAEILAAALALRYVQDTQRSVLSHIRTIRSYRIDQYLQIDGHSRDNLELTKTIREGRKSGSLL